MQARPNGGLQGFLPTVMETPPVLHVDTSKPLRTACWRSRP